MPTSSGSDTSGGNLDPRIDALMRWSLVALYGLSVTVATWFITDTRDGQEDLRERIRLLETENAVLRERVLDNRDMVRSQWKNIQELHRKLGMPSPK